MFPIGDDQVKGGYFPVFSYLFIFINVIVFIYEMSLSPSGFEELLYTFGSIPAEIARGEDIFTLFSSIFLHGGLMHLIGNMVFLWVFADNIEAVIGNIPFLIFYLLGGIMASIIHVFFNIGSNVPAVGASGAISAVLGAYLIMFPQSKIKTFVPPLFIFRIPAIFFLGIWILQQFMSGVASIGSGNSGGVAWWAHIGGFVVGVIAGFLYKNKANSEYEYNRDMPMFQRLTARDRF